MVCQKLCQKNVSGWGSLEQSNDCFVSFWACVAFQNHQASVWAGYLWWGAPAHFKHVTQYPWQPWFPFGLLTQLSLFPRMLMSHTSGLERQ